MTIHTIGTLEGWLAGRARSSRLGMPRAGTDPRNDGVTYERSWWWPAGYVLLGRAIWVTAEWNALDVLADECLPFGTLAEADLQSANGAQRS